MHACWTFLQLPVFLLGVDPYASSTPQGRLLKIQQGDYRLPTTGPRKLNSLFRHLFGMLLDQDPNRRPSLEAVISHGAWANAKEVAEMLNTINGT